MGTTADAVRGALAEFTDPDRRVILRGSYRVVLADA
jgi:hypothetical protein